MLDPSISHREKKLFIFDLGGVLIQNLGCQKIVSWSSQNLSVNDFNDKWRHSETVRDYEKGDIPARVFAEKLINEFSLAIGSEDLISEFSKFLIGFYDGTEFFLSELSKRYTLATLSTTNSIHWTRIIEVFHLDRYIAHNFPSHITGLVKPDRNAYEHILKQMHMKPQQALFFDDNKHNIDAASEMGIQSIQVNGIQEVISACKANGIL